MSHGHTSRRRITLYSEYIPSINTVLRTAIYILVGTTVI
jgi:hypothetical protein